MLTKIWRFIKRDPLRRAIALVLAFLLYLHLNAQLTTEHRLIRVRVPVTLQLESGLQQLSGIAPEVGITLKGKPGAEFHPANAQIKVSVDSSHRQPDGAYAVKVTPGDVKLSDRNFRLHSIDSPENGILKLALLRRGERNTVVRPVFSGTVPPGFDLSCELIPDKVLVTGAENVLSKLQFVHTAKIPLADAPEFFEYDTTLALPAQVNASPNRVLARVRLIRQFSRRSMHIPVTILHNPNRRKQVSLVTDVSRGVSLVLRGPAAKLTALTPDRVRVFVDTANLAGTGKRRVPLRCYVNVSEIEPVSVMPAEVEINIQNKDSAYGN